MSRSVVEEVALMQKAYLGLKQRAVNVALGLQGKMPQTGKPLASQQAFAQAFLKLKLVELLNEQIEQGLRGFAALLSEDSPPPSGLIGDVVELLADLLQSVGEEFGVENAAVLPALVANLEALIALVEPEVVQLEELAESIA